MSKKKKSYGFGNFPQQLIHKDVLWDFHAHIDMTYRYIQEVAKDIKIRKPQNPDVEILDIAQIVTKSIESGINGIVQCACDIEDILEISNVLDIIFRTGKETTELFKVCGAIALHPNEAPLHCKITDPSPDGLIPKMRQIHQTYDLEQAIEIAVKTIENDSRIKIVGETGLDYFRTSKNGIAAQKMSFIRHIDIAKQFSMPLQIHDREAHRDVLDVLKSQKPPDIVLLHSFSGDKEFAQRCIEEGYYASFSGPVTFKANNSLRDAFLTYYDKAPELLLLETDSPFLTPEPNRGQVNAPGFAIDTLKYLANFVNTTETELAQLFINNQKNILF